MLDDEDSPLPFRGNVHITIQDHLDLTSLEEAYFPIGSSFTQLSTTPMITIQVCLSVPCNHHLRSSLFGAPSHGLLVLSWCILL